MTADERWGYLVTLPALLLHPPIYVISTAYYCCCRAGFGRFLDFAADCQFAPRATTEVDTERVA